MSRELVRQFFCIVAIVALLAFALKTVFPYGPPSSGYDEPTTNPYYLAMSWYENLWRWALGGMLVGASFAVGLTMGALRDEKEQARHLQERLRQLLAGEILVDHTSGR